MWSKRVPKSVQFFCNWRCESATLMSNAVTMLCVYAVTLERCRFFFFVLLVEQGEGCFFFFWKGCYLPFRSFGLPPCLVELSPLSCEWPTKTVIVYLKAVIIWIPLVILELVHAYRPDL